MMPPVFKLLLAGIDIAVLAQVMALLVSNRKSQRHDTRSWATAFQVLVLGWLTLRGIFWILTIVTGDRWEADVFYLLYWLPNPLQFGSFLILPLFYSQVLSSKKEWREKSRIITPLYIALVAGMVVFMVVGTLLKALQERKELRCVSAAPESRHPHRRCYHMEVTSGAFRMLTALCFFALAAVVARYGLQMSKLTTSQNRLYFIHQPRALAGLNCFLCAVFLSKARGAYQVSSEMKLFYLPDIPLQGAKDVSVIHFAVFMLWDYVPTVWLLLVMMDTGASSRGGATSAAAVVKAVFPTSMHSSHARDTDHLPDYGLFREIKVAAAAAEEAARMEAQHRAETRSFENGLQYSASPGTETPPMANSWFREGDNNPSFGIKNSPFSSSFGSNSGQSTAGGANAGNLASSLESSLGGVAFVASPGVVRDGSVSWWGSSSSVTTRDSDSGCASENLYVHYHRQHQHQQKQPHGDHPDVSGNNGSTGGVDHKIPGHADGNFQGRLPTGVLLASNSGLGTLGDSWTSYKASNASAHGDNGGNGVGARIGRWWAGVFKTKKKGRAWLKQEPIVTPASRPALASSKNEVSRLLENPSKNLADLSKGEAVFSLRSYGADTVGGGDPVATGRASSVHGLGSRVDPTSNFRVNGHARIHQGVLLSGRPLYTVPLPTESPRNGIAPQRSQRLLLPPEEYPGHPSRREQMAADDATPDR